MFSLKYQNMVIAKAKRSVYVVQKASKCVCFSFSCLLYDIKHKILFVGFKVLCQLSVIKPREGIKPLLCKSSL